MGLLFALVGGLFVASTLPPAGAGWRLPVLTPSYFGYVGASLLLVAAGFCSAAITAYGRVELAAADATVDTTTSGARDGGQPTRRPGRWRWLFRWPRRAAKSSVQSRAWGDLLASIALSVAALATVVAAWRFGDRVDWSVPFRQVAGAALILLSFPLLVVNRIYAGVAVEVLPEAPQLERLLRVPLVTVFGTGIASAVGALGVPGVRFIEQALGSMVALVACELILRGLAYGFLPFSAAGERRAAADSRIAAQLRLKVPSLGSVSRAVTDEFGIDLSRSWALGFIRSAALPITAAVALFGWCVTGVTAVGLEQRAVYERLGVPVAVFKPGLHLHLPWPLGILRPVEMGVVHEVPLVLTDELRDTTGHTARPYIDTKAEDPPPRSADRLWDASHPAEASYLIASESAGQQGFQIADIDMRIVYRIGPTDADARNAAYAVADPEALVHAGGGRLLVRYFARYALADVLGQSREAFSQQFRNELQSVLDAQSSGIEVVAIIVETIHPPSGAASAFHNVQAAEIVARTTTFLRKAEAIQMLQAAERTATSDRNDATSKAAELVSKAQTDSILFAGDRTSSGGQPQAFLFERWLDRLSASLGKANLVVIDSRLGGADAPTVDLRSFVPMKEFAPSNRSPQ